ncbi:MAG: tetrahydrofolate dehydrogenase/cyclohydrolase catalytic domain-containing protein [Rhodococcus sp. (in: high G+C Gram-positive bacteria)]|uniref:bifunctional 5,10-methylenetetrahydrofolate dehydrogenase/5,10-methenyltetrahydrofolate cyclohydrolase n=1 Tax=Rhodococcus sp. TaxID=1831 RepID=UPI002AD6939D|nr:tetrahydrofolate dehydrogenase/cyclohydrolase catalytic domain-containing protein [Rhodococcus sp. (in: high G+C Gram-positive bacteria)]
MLGARAVAPIVPSNCTGWNNCRSDRYLLIGYVDLSRFESGVLDAFRGGETTALYADHARLARVGPTTGECTSRGIDRLGASHILCEGRTMAAKNLSAENVSSQSEPARIIDGRAIADAALADLSVRTRHFREQTGHVPCLAAVIVGSDPASKAYVHMKAKRSAAVGMTSRTIDLPVSATTGELVDVLKALSADPLIDGILLQHPVPDHIDERAAFDAISADKDVDGVTSASFAAMALTGVGFESCTPSGILRLLDATGVELAGKHAVVVGRSPILGLPMGMLLLRRGATVTYCHSRTVDLAAHVGTADVVIAAVGVPELIKGAWIKPGAGVIDAGYNAGNVGDVEFGAALTRAGAITPVPGGVGPMTVAVLLEQTLAAAVRAAEVRAAAVRA